MQTPFLASHGRQFVGVGILAACLLAPPAAAQDAPHGFRSYPLQHVTASDVAKRVRDAIGGAGSHANVLIDAESNQLVIKGSEEAHRIAGDLLNMLDQPPVPDPGRTKSSVPLPIAASEVRGYPIKGDLQATANQIQERYRGRPGFRLVVDEPTRRIIVVSSPEVHGEIASLLGVSSRAPGSSVAARPSRPAEGSSHGLQQITWRELEYEIRRLWGATLNFVPSPDGESVDVSATGPEGPQRVMRIDRRANRVTFFGNGRTVGMWNTFVNALDSSPNDRQNSTGLIPLRNADPSKVLYAVSLLQPKKTERSSDVSQALQTGVSQGRRPQSGGDMVSMIFRKPTLAAHAQEAAAPAQERPPAQDSAPAQNPAAPVLAADEAPGQTTQAIPLGNQPTSEVAGGGLVGSVQIEIINDVIILRGRADDVEKVKRMIEDIERLSIETQPAFEVHNLQFVNSEAVATLVSELYEEILTERQGPVSIRALVEPNAILLIGRKESVAVVKELLEKLDQPAEPSSKFEIFRLKHAAAVDVEATVRGFFVNNPGTDTTARPGIGTRVRAIADVRTNSLIVHASPRDLDEVRRMIESIDVDDLPAAAEFRIFKLKNALAADLATVLQSAITGEAAETTTTTTGTTTTTPTLPSNALELFMIDQVGGQLVRSGILTNVQITADANTNALLVRAPAKTMGLIAALIEQLDRLPDVSAQIKVFTIVNGDATNLATMLQTLFGLTSTSTTGVQTNLTLGGTTTTSTSTLQPATGGGETSVVPLRLSVDIRTNSIVASGSEADLRVIETILLRLDENLDNRKLSVVRLRNTQAAAVATALQSYLTNRQTRIQQQLTTQGAESVYEQIEQEVFIVSEDITNSIIVSATPEYNDEILRVIHELDVRQPMVLIQVLIAEVELRDTFQFGLELGFQEAILFDRGRAALNSLALGTDQSVPGFNFNNAGLPNANSAFRGDLGGQTVSTFGVGRTDPALGYGGLVVSAASDSISILLRALEDKGMVEILSRPQVMTMHNQPAYVQVGQDVARITGSTLSTFGTQNNVTDVSTGLILSILPLINDDGIVMLGVEAERSALGDEAQGTTVAIDANGNAVRVAPINVTRASTTISAQSGQTVVFAGLIQTENNLTLRRIPYLADIPVIGHAFEFKDSFKRRSELLIVMTPYVIRDEADMELIKLQESERMSWCLADVMSVGTETWGLQGGHCAFCTKDVPMIFPDLNPTVGDGPTMSPVPAGPPTPAHSSSRRGGQWQGATNGAAPAQLPRPETLPAGHESYSWPPQPEPDTAARREQPAFQTNPVPNVVSPAHYQPQPSSPVRLPPTP